MLALISLLVPVLVVILAFLDGSVDGVQDSLRKLRAFNQTAANQDLNAS